MTMEYARLGNTGLTVSRICLGCMSYGDPGATVAGSTLRWEWALKEDEARPFFHEIDASLRRLGTDYVDLYQIHRWDPATPIVGATKMEHLDAAARALDVRLSPDEVKQLEAPYVPHPIAGLA